MRALIVSDTHRHNENLEIVLKKVGHIDMLIHCGDAEGTEGHIQQICECPLYIVSGNNDVFSKLPYEINFEIDKYKAFLVHGHTYYDSVGIERLLDEAKARQADIVIFGHTHRPVIELRDNIMVINPGSISYPRQEGKIPSYVIMEIDKYGDASYTLNYLQ